MQRLLRWKTRWQINCFVAVCLPLTLGLGAWQLERAETKVELRDAYFERMAAEAAAPQAEPLMFERVLLVGRFEGTSFLVDNQVHQGRAGYWVVSSFLDESGSRYLVNRGWLAASSDRGVLPEVTVPGMVSTIGVVWPDTGLIPLLEDDAWASDWPKRVQRLNAPRMAALVEAEPFEIRLEPGQPGGLTAITIGTSLSPDRHLGYAVQWFGLALVLVCGYGFWIWKV